MIRTEAEDDRNTRSMSEVIDQFRHQRVCELTSRIDSVLRLGVFFLQFSCVFEAVYAAYAMVPFWGVELSPELWGVVILLCFVLHRVFLTTGILLLSTVATTTDLNVFFAENGRTIVILGSLTIVCYGLYFVGDIACITHDIGYRWEDVLPCITSGALLLTSLGFLVLEACRIRSVLRYTTQIYTRELLRGMYLMSWSTPCDGRRGFLFGEWYGGAATIVVLSVGVFIYKRHVYNRTNGEAGWSSTVTFLMVFYWFSLFTAVIIIRWGICDWADWQSLHFVINIFAAFPNIGLALLVTIVGRKRVFGLVARRFEKNPNRLKRDGAFMACMLDGVTVKAGAAWWVHHGCNHMCFPHYDPRRNWHRGRAISVDEAGFDVQLVGDNGAAVTLHRCQHTANGMSIEDMLHLAHCNLRCIDWGSMTEEIMTGAICGVDAADICNLYKLSRPVRPNEKIDFFMSHSWHDDAPSKWDTLKTFAAKFQRRHGRFPTFWLDKVCIDQDSITDGLKILPVNVMACQRILVLCGTTYPDRLWCIWELYTVLCFSDDNALNRLEFIAFGASDADRVAALQRLKTFSSHNAHCYDPNEENKLKSVIEAGGRERFDLRIRALGTDIATATREQNDKFARSNSIFSVARRGPT